MNAAHLAKMLGGEVAGRDRVLCPGPGHSSKDRSLSVTLSGEDFIVHSFAGDDWQSCKDYVRSIVGQGGVFMKPARDRADAPHGGAGDSADRTPRALALWSEARPLTGTPAEIYLASRGVPYTGPALRWHPSCPFGEGRRVGALIALVRNIIDGQPQAIHRTAIDRDGRKLSDLGSNGRLALGPTGGGAVRLFDIECGALGIGEGIESTLSIRRLPDLGNMPVWACLNAGGIGSFPVIPGLSALWIAQDNDPAGHRCAGDAVARMAAARIETIVLSAKEPGADLNDIGRVRHA
ncbi:toprim domain-containing protein [Shinella yambaruensis]|uniref:DUF7146 domain-containing protein n=1 Tax=Shinella yambaruensis TaxID=415996 RepID=UPI003D7B9C4C